MVPSGNVGGVLYDDDGNHIVSAWFISCQVIQVVVVYYCTVASANTEHVN